MPPSLTTARLTLDAFTPGDVPALVALAGHPDVAATTLRIPHPYTPEDGLRFVAAALQGALEGREFAWAVRREGQLIGGCGLVVSVPHDRADLGYWIARDCWGRGWATEAARAAVRHGFEALRLEKISAHHFAGNPASGRVLEKLGFAREGLHPRHIKKNGAYVDLVSYGLTRAAAVSAGLALAEPGGAPPEPAAAEPEWRSGPPPAHCLAAADAGAVERGLVQRHFLGRTAPQLEEELRVYGKSLAGDFARLAPGALAYYLPAARAYLESEYADGDWDFAHGFAGALAHQARGALPPDTAAAVRALLAYLREHAGRFFLETDKEPLAGWLKAAEAE